MKIKLWMMSNAGLLKDQLYREDLDQNDRSILFHCLSKLNGREEVLDYFLDYLPDEKNHERMEYRTLIYAILSQYNPQFYRTFMAKTQKNM